MLYIVNAKSYIAMTIYYLIYTYIKDSLLMLHKKNNIPNSISKHISYFTLYILYYALYSLQHKYNVVLNIPEYIVSMILFAMFLMFFYVLYSTFLYCELHLVSYIVYLI